MRCVLAAFYLLGKLLPLLDVSSANEVERDMLGSCVRGKTSTTSYGTLLSKSSMAFFSRCERRPKHRPDWTKDLHPHRSYRQTAIYTCMSLPVRLRQLRKLDRVDGESGS